MPLVYLSTFVLFISGKMEVVVSFNIHKNTTLIFKWDVESFILFSTENGR